MNQIFCAVDFLVDSDGGRFAGEIWTGINIRPKNSLYKMWTIHDLDISSQNLKESDTDAGKYLMR